MFYIKILTITIVVFAQFNAISQVKIFDRFVDAILLQYSDSNYLITYENLYHPLVGTYQKGGESSIGNRESRLSVYNLENGKLIAQKNLGIKDSLSDAFLLGANTNELWIYWYKYKSGLQALNPRTLERTLTMGQLYSKINPPVGLFVEPFPKSLNQFYGFEPVKQKLIVTNSEGKQFFISTLNFESESVNQKINLQSKKYYFNNNFVVGNLSFQIDPSGNNHLFIENIVTKQLSEHDLGLLELAFLMEQDPIILHQYYTKLYANALLLSEGSEKKKTLENANRNIINIENRQNTDNVPLYSQANQLLVTYKTGQEPDAVIGIAKLKYGISGNCSVVWKLPIQSMFFNVRTAQNSASYKKIFDTNQPDSEFRFFYLLGNKLIIVYLQQIACVDIDQGKLLWIRRL